MPAGYQVGWEGRGYSALRLLSLAEDLASAQQAEGARGFQTNERCDQTRGGGTSRERCRHLHTHRRAWAAEGRATREGGEGCGVQGKDQGGQPRGRRGALRSGTE